MGRLCDLAVLRCHTWMIVRWICCKFSEEIAPSQSHCNGPLSPQWKTVARSVQHSCATIISEGFLHGSSGKDSLFSVFYEAIPPLITGIILAHCGNRRIPTNQTVKSTGNTFFFWRCSCASSLLLLFSSAGVHHFVVLEVHPGEETAHYFYVVMDLCRGGELFDMINEAWGLKVTSFIVKWHRFLFRFCHQLIYIEKLIQTSFYENSK